MVDGIGRVGLIGEGVFASVGGVVSAFKDGMVFTFEGLEVVRDGDPDNLSRCEDHFITWTLLEK